MQIDQAARQKIAPFKQPRQVQAQKREQERQPRHHRRALQLKAPAQLLAARAQRKQQGAEGQEGQHHTQRIGQTGADTRRPVGNFQKTDNLDRQNRKHAGHQIEDHAAHQRAQ